MAAEVSPGLCWSLWPPARRPRPALEGDLPAALVPGVRQLVGAARVELPPSGGAQVARFSQDVPEAMPTDYFRGGGKGGVSAGHTVGLV